MTDIELERAILQRYVEHYESVDSSAPKCTRELDMRDVISDLTGTPAEEATATRWHARLAPAKPYPKGVLCPCSDSTVNNGPHRFHARAFVEPGRAPAWERIRDLESQLPAHSSTDRGEEHMAQKWYRSWAVQASIVLGISTIIAALIAKDQGTPSSPDGNLDSAQMIAEDSMPYDAQLAAIAADSNYNPITLEQFFDSLYAPNVTGLQRDELMTSMVGTRVLWEGELASIQGGLNNTIRVTLTPLQESFLKNAILTFGAGHRSLLLSLQEEQRVLVTCNVRDVVVLTPYLDQCSILRILD